MQPQQQQRQGGTGCQPEATEPAPAETDATPVTLASTEEPSRPVRCWGLTAALTSGLGSDAAVARWPGFDAAYEVGLGIPDR